MIVRNLEANVLQEMRIEKKPLNPKQRQELRIFCETWGDILVNLSSISDYSHAKGKIAQMTQKKHESLSISAYLRSELFYWLAHRNREGSSFDTKTIKK